jgi:ADP-L-glycero-D-manno-heptose 6-epimerase
MRILITGYRGFIGQNMCHALNGHDLAFYEWGDRLPQVDRFDWVVHLGAISSTTETDVEKIMTQNYDFSCWLLNECNDAGVNFQYSSSASVYGLNTDFREDSAKNPLSPYAWSKYLFDRYVEQGKWFVTVQGFRYFNVYGPHEDHKGNQASPHHKFTKQAETTGRIKVFEGSEHYKRDFISVHEVVDIHKKFFNIHESGIWNVGRGKAMSFKHLAETIAEGMDARVEYIPMPEELKSQYQTYTCADLTKLKATLNASNGKRNI